MAWIELLGQESVTGPRNPYQIKPPPPNAAKFQVRCNWSDDSRVDPGRHLQVVTERARVGSAGTGYTRIPQATFFSSGAPEIEPQDLPATGIVPLVNWSVNDELRFTVSQSNDSGCPPMNTGLQVRWFDANNIELDADGQVDPNPGP